MIRCLLIALLALTWSLPLSAAPIAPLDELLRQVQDMQAHDAGVRREREARFLADHEQRQQLLDEVKARLAQAQAHSTQLKTAFEANEKTLAELETELQLRTGDLGELFGSVRQSAKDIAALLEGSLVSAQYPERVQWFDRLGERKRLPDIAELERMRQLMQQEIVESGRVVRFPAAVVGTDGVARDTEVVRVGLFNALAGDRYLRYQPEAGRFAVLPRQPSAADRAAAAALAGASEGQLELALDPTRGVLLGLLVETPDLRERVQQGGLVGYIIVGLGLLGLLIGAVRLVYLALIGSRIRRQLADPANPRADNPLGRILAASRGALGEGNLELQVDEAILRETPPLTRGEGMLKLLAGVAPLLGLLGTVVGMIATFQAISLFGTGDPKLMASGISQALVTTALGLVVAIPLLFLHALVAARSRVLVRILDEQSAGLIAPDHESD